MPERITGFVSKGRRTIAITIMSLLAIALIPIPSAIEASSSTSYTQYTHSTQTATFTNASWSLSNPGATKTVSTDWGTVYLSGTENFLVSDIKYGGISVPSQFYCSYTENHFWNGTLYKASRQWSANWPSCNWYQLRDDTYCAVYEKWASDTNAWTGRNELNVTLRITILKQEPIILFNYWIKFLDPAQPYMDFTFQPLMYEGGSGCTVGLDTARALSYIYNATIAMGYMGYVPVAGVPSWHNWNKYAINYSARSTDKPLTGSSFMFLGSNRASLNDTAGHLSGMLLKNYAPSETYRTLVYAKNQDGNFDAFGYFPSTGYSYTPTGTGEFLYAGGTTSVRTFLENPIHNYDLVPYVTWVDDWTGGTSADWLWITNTATKYGVALTYGTTTDAIPTPNYGAWTALRDGTLIEAGDHYYNHANFWTTQGYAAQYNAFDTSRQEWDSHTGGTLISTGAAYGAWSRNTWDAALYDSYLNWRGGPFNVDGFMAADIYNGTDYLFVAAATSLVMCPTVTAMSQAEYLGYYLSITHQTDFDQAGEKTTVDAWFSLLENDTSLLPCTMSQWSDVFHNRLRYYLDEDRDTIDLSTATTSSLVMLPSDQFQYGLRDIDTHEDVRAQGEKNGYALFHLEAGHTYRTLYSHSVSNLINVTFILIAVGMVVGIMSETINTFRKKAIPDDEMTKRLLNMVLYIIIGLALLGAAYATIS